MERVKYPNKQQSSYIEIVSGEEFDLETKSIKGALATETEMRLRTDKRLQDAVDGLHTVDVEIYGRIEKEVMERMSADDIIHTLIDNEVGRLIRADAKLQNGIDELQTVINTERTERKEEDAKLQKAIDTEQSERTKADEAINKRIDNEIATRIKKDEEVDKKIADYNKELENTKATWLRRLSDEEDERKAADKKLQEALDKEIVERTKADKELRDDLDLEMTLRKDADTKINGIIHDKETKLKAAIDTEQSERTKADEAINKRIDALQLSTDWEQALKKETDERIEQDTKTNARVTQEIQDRQHQVIEEAENRKKAIEQEAAQRKEFDDTIKQFIQESIKGDLLGVYKDESFKAAFNEQTLKNDDYALVKDDFNNVTSIHVYRKNDKTWQKYNFATDGIKKNYRSLAYTLMALFKNSGLIDMSQAQTISFDILEPGEVRPSYLNSWVGVLEQTLTVRYVSSIVGNGSYTWGGTFSIDDIIEGLRRTPTIVDKDQHFNIEFSQDMIIVEITKYNLKLNGSARQLILEMGLSKKFKNYYKNKKCGRYYLPNTNNHCYLTIELTKDAFRLWLEQEQPGYYYAYVGYCNRLIFITEHI